ncbi:MAG: acetylxylan esterase [Planctomycetota bacterium]|nr:acetylxylan esterase [Planctomycetota bacterium]
MAETAVARSGEFLEFIRRSARELRHGEAIPESLDQWKELRTAVRKNLVAAIGLSTDAPGPVPVRKVGEQKKDGYRIEHLVLRTIRTRDGWIEMPANAYVPDAPSKNAKPMPAVLCVHGHWSGAKQDPVVQSRCIGLAKLGFFVLSVDAFGAGERGLKTPLGEYHGEMVAATLWPTGTLLCGIQVWENMRAVDYLQTRPEVDPQRLGVTGTSGGGNQTIYAGALDERFQCVVPVCSVGNYQAYLGAACCMCELVPGALTFTDEWQVLGLVAPRALMVINATRDAVQFSVGEARKSVAGASKVFDLYDRSAAIRHVPIESGHDYNQPMREAMYGWMTRHLKGIGDGSPIPEPKLQPEDREAVRVWPKDSRPETHISLPQYSRHLAAAAMKKQVEPMHAEHWESEAEWRVAHLRRLCQVPGGKKSEMGTVKVTKSGKSLELQIESEPGIVVTTRWHPGGKSRSRLALVLDLAGASSAARSAEYAEALESGWDVAVVELRATGSLAPKGNRVRRALDHNASQWAMWIGRPLVTQWVTDIRRVLEGLGKLVYKGRLPKVRLVGRGEAGPLAVVAGALEPGIDQVHTHGAPVSVITDEPYEDGPIGTLIPGSLKTIGDLPQLMSLLAPRPLRVVDPVTAGGEPLNVAQARQGLKHTRATYRVLKAEKALVIETGG